jgi:hypothetical protein
MSRYFRENFEQSSDEDVPREEINTKKPKREAEVVVPEVVVESGKEINDVDEAEAEHD